MTELKPCPFCGGDKVATIPCEGGFYVVCYDILHSTGEGCGSSSGWHETEQKAIEAWNRRVPDVNIEMAKAKGFL